jgi:EAL domain-containing protein (putative c-di-GMP-specific phosphodiesterase class I)
VAEATGLIDELGGWVLETAARQVAAWSRQGLSTRVAVNVSQVALAILNAVPDNYLATELLHAQSA